MLLADGGADGLTAAWIGVMARAHCWRTGTMKDGDSVGGMVWAWERRMGRGGRGQAGMCLGCV